MQVKGGSFSTDDETIGTFSANLPGAPLSPQFLEYLGMEPSEEPKAREHFNMQMAEYVKPCHDLGYCPYGEVVEMFPQPPATVDERLNYIEHLKDCLETRRMGPNREFPLDDNNKQMFEKIIAAGTEDCVEELSRFEMKGSCEVFNHICPVYFLADDLIDEDYDGDYDDEIDWDKCEACPDRDQCEIYQEHLIVKEAESALSDSSSEWGV